MVQIVKIDPSNYPEGKDNTVALKSFLDAHQGFTINWPAGFYLTHDRTLRCQTKNSTTKIAGALDDNGVPNCGTRVLSSTGGFTDFDDQRVRMAWSLEKGCEAMTFKNFMAIGPKVESVGRSPSPTDPVTGKKYRNVWEGQAGFSCTGTVGHTFCTVHSVLHWGDSFAIGGDGSGTDVVNCSDLTYRYCSANNAGRMAWLINGVNNLEIWNWEAQKYASGCFHTEMSANPLQNQNNIQIRDGHDHGGGQFVHCGSGQLMGAVQITGNIIDGEFRCQIAGKTQKDGSKGYQQWNVSNNTWTEVSGELINLWNCDGFLFQGNVGFIRRGQPYLDPDGLKTCLNVRANASENKIKVV